MRIASIIHGRLNNISPTSPPCEDFHPKDFAKIQTFPRVGGQLGREWEGMLLPHSQKLLNHPDWRGERKPPFYTENRKQALQEHPRTLAFCKFRDMGAIGQDHPYA